MNKQFFYGLAVGIGVTFVIEEYRAYKFMMEEKRRIEEALDDFEPTNLWRAIRNGQTWSESSNEKDVRSRMEHGDVLQNLYIKTERQWRTAK